MQDWLTRHGLDRRTVAELQENLAAVEDYQVMKLFALLVLYMMHHGNISVIRHPRTSATRPHLEVAQYSPIVHGAQFLAFSGHEQLGSILGADVACHQV